MVKWSFIEAPKSYEGLGVGNLKLIDMGMLLKWWNRYLVQDEALEKRVVIFKGILHGSN